MAASWVALRRSPPTPEELSSTKKSRSPASDASDTSRSASYSERQWVKRSSGGMWDTNPPTLPRRSMVAMSIMRWRLTRCRATAWQASWMARAWRSCST